MTLEEAIRQLEAEARSPRYNSNTSRRDAIKLGIEALKCILSDRRANSHLYTGVLPGES